MPTIRVVLPSPLAPERVLQAACDFSERRADVWPAVSVPRLTVHDRGDTWADVTEGTRAGPIVNWERCRYDWSQPGSVTAPVTDSNVYAFPASSWEIKATPTENGSHVEMIWVREFRAGPRGRLFGTLFRLVGKRLFTGYAQGVLTNLARLEQNERPLVPHDSASDRPVELASTPLDSRASQ
jgi:Polyketide cyclase / dehydrase and lipid transport